MTSPSIFPASSTKEEIIRRRIIVTAQKLFQKEGLDGVTMEDVAEAVGKAKSSLYYYYKSKEEIWDAVMDVEIGEIVYDIERAVNHADTTEQKIHAFCGTMLISLRKRRALYNIAYGTDKPIKRNSSTRGIRRRFVARESVLFNKILNEGVEKGEIKAMNPEEQNILVFVLLSGLKGLEKEIVLEKDYNLEPAIITLSHMIINGLKA